MNHCWNEKDKKLCVCSAESSSCESDAVLINIVVKEFVNDYVPFSIVACKISNVPPVFIEESIAESQDFTKEVQPAMKNSIEHREH